MSDNVESIVLEHLRHIRGKIDQIANDMTDIKQRLSSLELAMVSQFMAMKPMHDNKLRWIK